jgi:hypothetical protein
MGKPWPYHSDTELRAATKALKNLRNVLDPVHRALKMVFGELDAANIESDSAEPSVSPPRDAGESVHRRFSYWQAWETKLGGKTGAVIHVLVEHGRMTRGQIRQATNSGWSTVDAALLKLKGLSLAEKNGDHWSLKQNI